MGMKGRDKERREQELFEGRVSIRRATTGALLFLVHREATPQEARRALELFQSYMLPGDSFIDLRTPPAWRPSWAGWNP